MKTAKRCSHCGEMVSLDMFDADPRRENGKTAACKPCVRRARYHGRTEWCCQTYKGTAAARGHIVRIPGKIFEGLGSPTHIVWKLGDNGDVNLVCKYDGEDAE